MNLSGKSGDWNNINKDPKRFVEEYDFNQSNLLKVQFGQLQKMPTFAQAELSESFYKRYSANVPRLIRWFAVMHLFRLGLINGNCVFMFMSSPKRDSWIWLQEKFVDAQYLQIEKKNGLVCRWSTKSYPMRKFHEHFTGKVHQPMSHHGNDAGINGIRHIPISPLKHSLFGEYYYLFEASLWYPKDNIIHMYTWRWNIYMYIYRGSPSTIFYGLVS